MKQPTKDSSVQVLEAEQAEKQSTKIEQSRIKQAKIEKHGKFAYVIHDGIKYAILIRDNKDPERVKKKFIEKLKQRIK